MAGYIGKVQIGTNDAVLIGSTLYGICKSASTTAVKTVISSDDNSGKFINNNYDNLIQGSTIHIKFVNGNSVTSGLTLQVGTTNQAKPVDGNCVCEQDTILSFTYDENEHWVINDAVDKDTTYTFAEGTTNGTINVTPVGSSTAQSVTVHGLNDAAYAPIVDNVPNNNTSTAVPTVAAVYSYIQQQTGGLAGLTGAMHFRGIATTAVSDGGHENPEITNYDFGTNGASAVAGDVVLYNEKEYVWTGTVWELLGDEGSYALKSNTDTITEVTSFTSNTLPTLTINSATVSNVSVSPGSAASLVTTAVSIPNVTTAGIATTASVTAGILKITLGRDTGLGTAISITAVNSFTANTPTTVTATEVVVGSASGWNAGTTATLSTNDTTVVVPGT